MSEWKEVKLGDICTELSDGLHKAPLFVERGDYIFVNAKNLCDGVIVDNDPTKKTTHEEYLKYSKPLNENTILFSIDGTIGNIARYKGEKCVLGKGACYINPNPVLVDSSYIYFQLQSPHFNSYLNCMSTGSTIKHISLKTMRNYEFTLPPLSEQRSIASILSALDDKIAVNRRICENLEALAQALFKHWFIDFAPFKNGKFVESELGMIPEGWRVGRLGDVADITMGQSPAGSSYNEKGEGIFFYQGRTEFGFRYPSVRLYTTEPKRFAEPLSTLLSVRAPVGDINVATDKCCIGRGLASIKSNNNCHSYIFYLLQSMKRRFDVYNGEGTVFGSINKDTLNGLKIIIPSNSILLGFEEIVEEMDKKILGCHQENLRLSTLRDTLLPKLMSGQIKV